MYKTEIINKDCNIPCPRTGVVSLINSNYLYCNGVFIKRGIDLERLNILRSELDANGWCVHSPAIHFMETPLKIIDILIMRNTIFKEGSKIEKVKIEDKIKYTFEGNMINFSYCFEFTILDEKVVNEIIEYAKSKDKLTNLEINI